MSRFFGTVGPDVPRVVASRVAGGRLGAMRGFGIDIGGSGVKGAPVDLDAGRLETERFRIPTPQPATPEAVAEVVAQVVAHFGWSGPVGVTFPAVVSGGVTRTAANVDHAWIGTDADALFSEAIGQPAAVLNDADAAGVAEMRFGAGRGRNGVVLVTTLGTGIGSALFTDGVLVPNTELGHLEIDGHDAESRASDAARDREDLTWSQWAERLQRYYRRVEDLFWPDLIIVGGGVSKKAERFLPLLDLRTEIVTAELLNGAGIVGAALQAADRAVAA
jgi:polyphosphate glucokinase